MTRRQSKAARAAAAARDRARNRTPARPPLPAHAIARLGVVSDRAIAAELGIPTRHVAEERQALGIAPIRAGRKLRAGVRATVGRTIWLTPAEAAAHDAAAARAGLAWSPWMVGLANAATATAPTPDSSDPTEIEPPPGWQERAVARAKREGVL